MSDSVQDRSTQLFPDGPDRHYTASASSKNYAVQRTASYSATVKAMYDDDGYDPNSECDL
jgi:hypothetical protein